MANKQPDSSGLLCEGKPGRGRPRGSRNKRSVAYDAMAKHDAEQIIGKVVAKALEGDMNAAQIVLSRIWRVPRDRLVKIDLPPMPCAADVPAFIGAVLDAVADVIKLMQRPDWIERLRAAGFDDRPTPSNQEAD